MTSKAIPYALIRSICEAGDVPEGRVSEIRITPFRVEFAIFSEFDNSNYSVAIPVCDCQRGAKADD